MEIKQELVGVKNYITWYIGDQRHKNILVGRAKEG